MRKWLLVLFGCATGFGLAEGGLRAYLALAPDPPGSAYVRDAEASYRLRPDAPGTDPSESDDHVNAFGFRDREHAVAKPAGTYRILGIGDSFVYGAVPTAQNFLRVAEARLNAAGAGQPVETVLMGLGGYSTENEVGVLRSTGLGLGPDLAVLCFFVGNDVTGIPVRGEVLFGRLYYTGAAARWRHLLRHSRVYVLAEMFYVTRIKAPLLERLAPGGEATSVASLAMSVGTPPAEAGAELVPPLDARYVDIESRNVPVYRCEPGAAVAKLWDEAERQILAFDELCRAAGVPWVLFVIPEELQVDPRVRAALVDALGLTPGDHDFELPQRRLAEFARRHDIGILDPLPGLRAAHRAEARLYVPNDTHWNAAGNRLAGELLAAAIQDRRRTTISQGLDTNRPR